MPEKLLVLCGACTKENDIIESQTNNTDLYTNEI